MRKYLNGAEIPLSVAVYLATDNYDHESHTISATALLKPTRQLILAERLPPEHQLVDIVSLVKSRHGTAVHDAIERAWVTNHKQALIDLGYPKGMVGKVLINPEPEQVTGGIIPVYMEQRLYKEYRGHTISGKFDFLAEGRLEDFKNTSTFTWINDNKAEDYSLQGSIYRWLDPVRITNDHIAINYLFSDWMPGRAQADPKYPKHPVMQRLYPLLSLAETEQFVAAKLAELARHKNTPEEQLPLCNDKDLWRSAPEFKYYKNPQKMARSTKNFDNIQDAYQRRAEDGNVGIVVEKPGQVMACKYCPAFALCSQKDALIADGSLQL